MTENYYPISLNGEGSGFSVINAGTAPAPCVLTIVPRVNYLSMTITGLTKEPIILSNIAANDVVVIDGEKKEFTINGSLAWDKFEAWSFPHLEPGENIITITSASMLDIEVAYNARYI